MDKRFGPLTTDETCMRSSASFCGKMWLFLVELKQRLCDFLVSMQVVGGDAKLG